MRKILCFICAIFIAGVARADTIDINWLNENGTTYDTTTCTVGGTLTLPTNPTKYGHTFIGWRAPYTPVEYLESTGTQYIDTGTVAEPDCEIEIKYMIKSIPTSGFNAPYGAVTTDSEPNARHLYSQTNNLLINSDSQPPYFDATLRMSTNVDYIEKMDSTKWVINEITYNNPYVRTSATTGTMRVFNRFSSNTSNGIVGKVYYFKMRNTGSLVHDFIPVLDINGVACMYDKVSNTFFYNAGTGNFTAGPVIAE